MSKENPESARPMIQTEGTVERSAGHVAVQAAGTIATGGGLMLGGLAAQDLYGAAKDKLGSKGGDSKD